MKLLVPDFSKFHCRSLFCHENSYTHKKAPVAVCYGFISSYFKTVQNPTGLNSLILYMTYTGMFLSLLVLLYDGFRGVNRYLSGFLFFSSFYLFTQLIITYSKNVGLLGVFGFGLPNLYYLIGPFGYFYVRGMLLDRASLKNGDWLHFLPALLIISGSFPFLFGSSWELKKEVARIVISDKWTELAAYRTNRILPILVNEVFKGIHGFFYVILIWRTLLGHVIRLKKNPDTTPQWPLIRNWLFIFSTVYTVLVSMRLLYSVILTRTPFKQEFLINIKDYLMLGAIGYILLNIILIAYPGILYGLFIPFPLRRRIPKENSPAIPVEVDGLEESKKEFSSYNQSFSETYLLEMQAAIQDWVSLEKFREPDCTMRSLAKALNIPMHHLAYYFKYVSQDKFIEWRNKLRIQYAKQLVEKGQAQSVTLEAIGIASGFATRATFYRVFKQECGQTPSEYADRFL